MSEITKGMKTKKKIYETAEKLFKQHGVDQISVNHIVQKAGISKGTFYIHYKSKLSLIEEYVQTLDLNYEEYFNSIPENVSATSMIYLVTKKTAQVLVKDIGYEILRNSYAAMLSAKLDTEMILNYSRSLPLIYKKIIFKGIHDEEFKAATDADYFTRQLMIAIRGMTFEWCICCHEFDLEEELLKHINLLLEGLK